MHKRPIAVTVISGLFLLAGAVGLAYHASECKLQVPFRYELVWVCLLRVLAIVGAVFMFRGQNWARWLILIWLAYHVVLSAFHALPELIMHAVLLAVIAWFLFRPSVSAFFHRAGSQN